MRGLSLSWEPAVATTYLVQPVSGPGWPPRIIWSPCSKLIAASTTESVEVLDALTLNRLATFKYPPDYDRFSFSPDSRSLALFTGSQLISWDIQTGGRLSEILLVEPGELSMDVISFTYSKDEKMVAVACETEDYLEHNVYTFDLPSRIRLGPLPVPNGQLATPIWTHDEYLRFAIINPGSITIWEVEFTLKHPPTQVESFSIPDDVADGDEFLFLPILYRLAFTFAFGNTIQVWDVKASKLLLKSELGQASNSHPKYSFSSDGRFFAFAIKSGEVHIWKESPTGYALHQQPPFFLDNLEPPLLSPNGRSIIFPLDDTINLWHTDDQTLPPPSPQTEVHDPQRHFLLAFSPDEKSAAFAEWHGNVVTILDLRSGDLRLTIDAGMTVGCVGVTGGTVIVVDDNEVATWNLYGGDRAFKANINDRARTVLLDRSPPFRYIAGYSCSSLSLSPDLSCIAAVRFTPAQGSGVGPEIHHVATGTCLASTGSGGYSHPQFTRDGREVWIMDNHPENDGWEIIQGGVSGAMELKPLEETLYPSRTFLWHSIRGYKVTDNGWVLSPTGKRLLWLPHRWRTDREEYRLWSGQFLGLTHWLSELVILEFLE